MIATLVLFIILSYLVAIGSLSLGFDKVNHFNLQDQPSKHSFSVIIPFRNEAQHLERLLQSLQNLNYSKALFEVIFVNDHSDDHSVAIIEDYISRFQLDHMVLLHALEQGKKSAISFAVHHAKHEWIVTTDADCCVPKYWLDSYDEFIQSYDPKLVAGPVTYAPTHTFLDRFQLLNLLSLQGATIGAFGIKKPMLCNGANMAYEKSIFNDLKAYKGNLNIASGDDVFLLEKIRKQYPKDVHYLKAYQAVVTTAPELSFKALKTQYIRWASKAKYYNYGFTQLIGLIVFLGNALVIALIPLVLVDALSVKYAFYIFVIKLSIDFLLLFKSARFFKQESALFSYLFSALLYPFFNTYIAVISQFIITKWKGRPIKKA